MALRTVRATGALEPVFAAAEEIVSRYFLHKRNDPSRGTIEIHGERYVLVRAASLSVEFFSLVEELYGPGREAEADEFARNILFDLAHAIGKSDAQSCHAKTGLVDPLARMAAGTVSFAYMGWASVEVIEDSTVPSGDAYYSVYDHLHSFEAEAWLKAGKRRSTAACIMSAGYSSGWAEESIGRMLVATEVLCRAKGDAHCRFIMAHPDRIEAHVERWRAADGALERQAGGAAIPDFFVRKRMEEELRKAQSELERRVEERTAELTRANERLLGEIAERQIVEKKLLQTYKLEAIGRLAGGIAHDFNNLMAVVALNCDLLRRSLPPGDPMHAFVDDIAGAGARAAGLTQQLLAFSRAQPRRREVLDLNRIVADLGRLLSRVIGEDIHLVPRLSREALLIEGDRGHLEQVLMNLAVNARDAMPGGGTLTITTAAASVDAARGAEIGVSPGEYAELTVEDSGTGMDEPTLAQIFDPFFTTKESGKGTGLGLSTVYGIVKQSGGGISVSSAPGVGTRFSIHLPRVTAAAAERGATGAVEATPRGTETILVAEDQARLRQVLGVVLRRFGYTVLEAADTDDALRIAREHPGEVHLLLSDVVMPRRSGPALAEEIRAIRPGIKVLFMSGYADGSTLTGSASPRLAPLTGSASPRLAPLTGSASPRLAPLLQKPFEPDELGRRVREMLDGERG